MEKEENSITLIGSYMAEPSEVTACAAKASSGDFGEISEANLKNVDANFKKCIEPVLKEYGKKSIDFNVTGSITQVGKDIFFSMEGNELNPIPGKKKFEFDFSKKNEKVCVHGLK